MSSPASSLRQFSLGCFALALFATFLGVATSAPAQSAAQQQSAPKDQSSTQTQQAPPDKPDKKDKKPSAPGMVRLRIEVVGGADGKPIGNASVYVRYNEPGGFLHKDKLAELNFKTNQDGSAKVPEVPQGKILIQVIAKGWHTYGKWYDVDTDEQTIQVKLEPPPHWY
ncbi:MAG TPA: carboxypeptidase-like regulatory domain-containing protein [Candidatus Acidoferrales bacterium]|nr:carboxypeptidase-like regulatory domain-containing protein [Candidatus Acidoferrales bacterium]